MTKENYLLKTEKCVLSKNVEKLNSSVVDACEKEKYWRDNSETCAASLKASIGEIKNLNTEVECLNEKLNEVEKTLKNTESRLAEETSQKEIFKEKYHNMVDKCKQLDELESLIVQNDIQINSQKSEIESLSNENQKYVVNNIIIVTFEIVKKIPFYRDEHRRRHIILISSGVSPPIDTLGFPTFSPFRLN